MQLGDRERQVHFMGFFVGELVSVLETYMQPSDDSPWSVLARIGIPDQQIDRLESALDDITVIASLPTVQQQFIQQELELLPREWARLQAGAEADVFLRLLLWHNTPLEDAA